MTRYFEVKVTGCKNCPNAVHDKEFCNLPMSAPEAELAYLANFKYLTEICPMWDKTKECETK